MDDQIENLEQAIREALIRNLPNVDIRFDPYPGFGKLHPVIVWNGFQDMSFLDRQHFVWDVLRKNLTDEQRYTTGFLLLVAPAEMNAMQEASAMDEAMDGIIVTA